MSAAASARANLIESKQQINILESHTKRLSTDRASLSSQLNLFKERLSQLQQDYDRQGDDLLREKTLRQSELAKLKIDKLEKNIDTVESEALNGKEEVPDELPLLHESQVLSTPKCDDDDEEGDDDLEQLTLRIDDTET